ncbi:MAG: MmgE/PrpD family protein [Negativicutes bacterium]
MVELPKNLETEIAEFIAQLHYEDLPSVIVEDMNFRILDWIGCALAGTRTEPSRIVCKMVKETGGVAQATLIREGVKVPMSQAVWANGVAGHVVEFDDGHRLAVAHPGAVTVPVALAVGEYLGSTGKEIITAAVAGYEILIRLGIAVSPSHYKYWHTTSTCGAFAAAGVAASLLKLNAHQTLMAMGIVGTLASGLQETFGAYAKPLNIGHACQSGIQAALLAKEGFTGPATILMGKKGFVAATSSDRELKLLEQINEKNFISHTAFFKMYSSCGHTHSPLDAIFSLMQEYEISVQAIRSIQIDTYRVSVELTGELKNQSEEEAKFSLPYCIACALLCGKITLDEFTPEKLASPEIIELARKIRVVEDVEATKAFPARHANIRIEFADGRVLEKKVQAANDTPQYESLKRKFVSLAVPAVDTVTALKIQTAVLNLERLDNIKTLMQDLA